MISIITPVYNEEENINCFYDAVTAVMKQVGMDYELIYVNDGSRDGTEKEISRLAAADPHVRAVSLARNFGHQIALTCGMDLSSGDAIITMDGDMQHPPALIPALIARWQEGYDIVQTVRETTENASLFKRVTSAAYYKLMNAISATPVVPGGSDFRLMDRKAISVFRRFREHSRFIRGIVGGLGFRQTTLSFKAPARHAGTSKFSLRKMLHLAMDGIITNSTVPLRMTFYIGFLGAFAGLLMIIYVCYCHLAGITVPGWSTTVILLAIFGSVNLMVLGILGEYIGRIFEETKQRPLYWLASDSKETEPDRSFTGR